jgi:hypothetical protein
MARSRPVDELSMKRGDLVIVAMRGDYGLR